MEFFTHGRGRIALGIIFSMAFAFPVLACQQQGEGGGDGTQDLGCDPTDPGGGGPPASGTISASAPVCPIESAAAGATCSLTIHWNSNVEDSPGNEPARVYVSDLDGSGRTLFAQGKSGSSQADWISAAGKRFTLEYTYAQPSPVLSQVEVRGNHRPVVGFNSPAASQRFVAPADVPISVSASDTDGSISALTVRHNGQVIRQVGSGSLSHLWAGRGPGSYTLQASATDNDPDLPLTATTTVSFEVVESVVMGRIDQVIEQSDQSLVVRGWACSTYLDQSIDVHLYAGPAEGGQLLVSGTADLASEPELAPVCEASGTRYRFELPVSAANRVGHVGASVYAYGLSPVAGGANRALDNSGAFEIPIVPSLVAAPSPCQVDHPTEACSARLTWNASASSAVQLVRKQADGTYASVPGAVGPSGAVDVHGITVQGVQYDLLVNGQAAASVTVRANLPPSVSLTRTPDWEAVQQGSSITLQANASDPEGELAEVRFYRDGIEIGRLTDGQSSLVVPASQLGNQWFSARAIDVHGASSDSASIAVYVVDPSWPVSPPPAAPPLDSDLPVSDLVSDRVGATAGEFRVDESGAATYLIPVHAAPGVAGVRPELSLVYSSQGGSSQLGRGWNIGGVSSIQRCRRSREAGDFMASGGAFDGFAPQVSFGAEDALCLDGSRLIAFDAPQAQRCPAVSGFVATQYRTELESYQRICAYSPSGAQGAKGPRFFTVNRMDGSTSWYGDRVAYSTAGHGARPDGVLEANGGHEGVVFSWHHVRFHDSLGNFIDYRYFTDPLAPDFIGEAILKEVFYTGKLGPDRQTVTHQPFASIRLDYENKSATERTVAYVAGSEFAATQRLRSITAINDGYAVRHLALDYEGNGSGSGDRVVSRVQECTGPDKTVCLPATRFEWSEVDRAFGALHASTGQQFGTLEKFKGFRFADVSGDGRLDLVWIKDGDGMCRTQVFVAFNQVDPDGRPFFRPPTNRVCVDRRLEGGHDWFLYDHDGDGRADLFVRASLRWVGWPSLGSDGPQGHPWNTAYEADLAAGTQQIPTGADSDLEGRPQLADITGNGLMDLVYVQGGQLVARIKAQQQGGGFQWGSPVPVAVNYGPGLSPCAGVPDCSYKVSGLYRTGGHQQLVDFNGDGHSDLLVVMERTTSCGAAPPPGDPGHPGTPQSTPTDPASGESTATSSTGGTCTAEFVDALVVDGLEGAQVSTRFYGRLNRLYDRELYFADVTGNGLSDLVVRADFDNPDGTTTFNVRLNTGAGFEWVGASARVASAVGLNVLDVNGSGRADLVYPDVGNDRFLVRHGTVAGTFLDPVPLPGNVVPSGCTDRQCLLERAYAFVDLDGDGSADFLRIHLKDGLSPVHLALARPSESLRARDVVVAVENGLGARTEIDYAPLSHPGVHEKRRQSRAVSAGFGRGSPVSDYAPVVPVVVSVRSSAPTLDDPGAMAEIHYRYVGGRIQAGGRGLLGFEKLITIDAGHDGGHVWSYTRYRQDFPFTGRAVRTARYWVPGGFNPAVCGVNGAFLWEGCFASRSWDSVPSGASLLGLEESSWAATPGVDNGSQRPIHVYLASSIERAFDPASGVQLTEVESEFQHGAFGNLLASSVRTYGWEAGHRTLLKSVSTSNTFGQDDPGRWFLGRLTRSVVTHARPGTPSVVRETAFAYDMSANGSGMLLSEAIQPDGGLDQSLTTHHVYDGFGNQVASHTCSAHFTAAECKAPITDFMPADPLVVHRASHRVFDARGRFLVEEREYFRTGIQSHALATTSRVHARDVFGNPVHVTDVNNTAAVSIANRFGRPFYNWVQSEPGLDPGNMDHGVASFQWYRWCGSGSDRVSCPDGAVLRREVMASIGAPTTWTYIDAIGREVMGVAETFNAGVAGSDLVASCTTHDARGRVTGTTDPFFLPGTSGPQGPGVADTVCRDSGRHWNTIAYDMLDRPVELRSSANVRVQHDYDGLTTHSLDPESNIRTTRRNAAGDTVQTIDDLGTETWFEHDATGNLILTRRGNDDAGWIHTHIAYDVLGRKVYMLDPDAGASHMAYNAAGELIETEDAAGNVIASWFDARGREVRRTNWSAAHDAVEATYSYTFDLALHGKGQLASEQVSGAYLPTVSTPIDLQIGHGRAYTYDSLGRPVEVVTSIGAHQYVATTVFDALGRPSLLRDESGRWTRTEHDERGFVRTVCDVPDTQTDAVCGSAGTQVWREVLATNARGRVIQERLGGQATLPVSRVYEPRTGRLTTLCVGLNCRVFKDELEWSDNGNLERRRRSDEHHSYDQRFDYDPLNRLVSSRFMSINGLQVGAGEGVVGMVLDYDHLGNICRKQTGGTSALYTYAGRAGCGRQGLPGQSLGIDSASPHAVTASHGRDYSYDARGNQVFASSGDGQPVRHIDYTVDNRAWSISNGNRYMSGTLFKYGSDGQRYQKFRITTAMRGRVHGEITHYVGNLEIEGVGSDTPVTRRYVAGVGLQRITDTAEETTLLVSDHLGSVVRVVSLDGHIVERMDYDEHGARRSMSDPRYPGLAAISTPRGFTGHEHLDVSNIVHMNGRIYDHRIGRFLQADPFVQAPYNSQSHNRYTYVFNNPLVWTDPSGYLGQKERQWLGALITIAATSTGNFWVAVGGGFVGGAVATQSLEGGLMGAFAAGVTAGIGLGGVDGGTMSGFMVRAVAGGGISVLQGGKFGHGFAAAGTGMLVGNATAGMRPGSQFVLSTLAGGAASRATGGKFANGAVTAALQMAFSRNGGRSPPRQEVAVGALEEIVEPSPTEARRLLAEARRIFFDMKSQGLFDDLPIYKYLDNTLREHPAAADFRFRGGGPRQRDGYLAQAEIDIYSFGGSDVYAVYSLIDALRTVAHEIGHLNPDMIRLAGEWQSASSPEVRNQIFERMESAINAQVEIVIERYHYDYKR